MATSRVLRGLLIAFLVACSGSRELELPDATNPADAGEVAELGDTLCNPTTGVWTRQLVAHDACTVNVLGGGPVFDVGYHERDCRAVVDPMLAAASVKLATPAVIDACRRALDTHTCDPEHFKDWVAATRICNDVLVGTQQTGEACSVDDECAGESFCSNPGTCGVCAPLLANGNPAESSSHCQSGVRVNGKCSVGNLGGGAECEITAQCGAGLFCDARICRARASIGQSCDDAGAECSVYEAGCVRETAGVGICEPLGKLNEACVPFGGDDSLTNCEWFSNLGCIAGHCQQLPAVGDGERCGFDLARCAAPLACLSGTCRAIAPEGGFCNDDATCGRYAFCIEHACTFTDFNGACLPEQ